MFPPDLRFQSGEIFAFRIFLSSKRGGGERNMKLWAISLSLKIHCHFLAGTFTRSEIFSPASIHKIISICHMIIWQIQRQDIPGYQFHHDVSVWTVSCVLPSLIMLMVDALGSRDTTDWLALEISCMRREEGLLCYQDISWSPLHYVADTDY